MGTRAIIAVTLADGTLLASNVAMDGDRLGDTLATHFPSFASALGLVALGDLMSVSASGSMTLSATGPNPTPYSDLAALDAGKLGNAHHVHLFRDGEWDTMLDDEGQFQEWLASLLDDEIQPSEQDAELVA